MSIEESVREAEQIGREAVSADVRGLPDRLTSDLAQRFIDGIAEFRAALVAPSMRADEKERFARNMSVRSLLAGGSLCEINLGQLRVIVHSEFLDERIAL